MAIRNNLGKAVTQVRNFVVHHKRTILPYGVIFVVLTGVWFLWDGQEAQEHIIRETKNESHSSSPVFSTSDTAAAEKGTVVYSTASAVRNRPLPDLFARSLPKPDGPPVTAPTLTAVLPETAVKLAPSATIPPPPLVWPRVQGTMQSGAKRLVVLQTAQTTKVCAAGEYIDGYYVTYIHDWAVGIQKDEQTIELPL